MDILNINFGINVLLHVLILYTILAVFFMVYISKIVSRSMKHELKSLTSDGVSYGVDNLSSTQQDYVRQLVKNSPIDTLKMLYSRQDDTVRCNNNWLFSTIILINVFVFIIFVSLVSVLKFSCNKNIHFADTLGENLFIFSLVGAVELWFFLSIGKNFIPVSASFMTKSIINNLKKNI